jgi:hypothetical protein
MEARGYFGNSHKLKDNINLDLKETRPRELAQVVTSVLSSGELSDWNLGQDTCFPDRCTFVVFLCPSRQISGRYLKSGHDHFFHIISSYHNIGCSVHWAADSVVKQIVRKVNKSIKEVECKLEWTGLRLSTMDGFDISGLALAGHMFYDVSNSVCKKRRIRTWWVKKNSRACGRKWLWPNLATAKELRQSGYSMSHRGTNWHSQNASCLSQLARTYRSFLWRVLSSGMWRRVVRWKFTNVSEELTVTIFSVEDTQSDQEARSSLLKIFSTRKNGSSVFLRNVYEPLPDYTMSQHRR